MSDEIQNQQSPLSTVPPTDFDHDPVGYRRFRRRCSGWLWSVMLWFVVQA